MHWIKNKKILEAVDKGIQIALDDYEDIQPNSSISSATDIIDDKKGIKHIIDVEKITVDLGLPSGTRWCKHNLGANLNSDNPHEFFGNYYSWGETVPKETYNWDYYKLAKLSRKDSVTILKYFSEENDTLMPEDDAATILLGDGFHIPSIEQWHELLDNTTLELDTDYEYKTNMFVLRSKINGKAIGIFGSGTKTSFNNKTYDYDNACLWTSNIGKDSKYAYRIAFTTSSKDATFNISEVYRCTGYPIRAVYN